MLHKKQWKEPRRLKVDDQEVRNPSCETLGDIISKKWPISELLLASFSNQGQVQNHSYENEFSFTCKLNLYLYDWFCTWPLFEKEAKSNSEIYGLLTH